MLACVTPLLTVSSHTNYLSYIDPFSRILTVSRKISQMCYALCQQFSGKGQRKWIDTTDTLCSYCELQSYSWDLFSPFQNFANIVLLSPCILCSSWKRRALSEISPTLITQFYVFKYLKDQFKSLYFELHYVFHEMQYGFCICNLYAPSF